MRNHSISFYKEFYKDGGWKYNYEFEKNFIEKQILSVVNLSAKSKILELGCGLGFHAMILNNLGFSVIAIDNCEEAISKSRQLHKGIDFRCLDASDLPEVIQACSIDMIYCRGMSWFHYELLKVNKYGINIPEKTEMLFGLLKPGGYFMLQISTDFSSTISESGVHNNTLENYYQLFEQFGDVISVRDWNGHSIKQNNKSGHFGILIITKK